MACARRSDGVAYVSHNLATWACDVALCYSERRRSRDTVVEGFRLATAASGAADKIKDNRFALCLGQSPPL